jgi:hypothetical protein
VPDAKKARKGKVAKAPPVEMQEELCSTLTDASGSARAKFFLEDLSCCIDAGFKSLPFTPSPAQLTNTRQFLIGIAMEFVWAGKVQIDAEQCVDYSVVRRKLQNKILSLSLQDDDDDDGLPEIDIAESLLKSLEESQGMSGVDNHCADPRSKVLGEMFSPGGDLAKFITLNNLKRPVQLHPALRSMLDTTMAEFMDTWQAVPEITLTESIGKALRLAGFCFEWVPGAVDLSVLVAKMGKLPAVALLEGLGGGLESVEALAVLRTHYMIQVLLDLDRMIPSIGLGRAVFHLRPVGIASIISVMDVATKNESQWAQAWARLLVNMSAAEFSPTKTLAISTVCVTDVLNTLKLVPAKPVVPKLSAGKVLEEEEDDDDDVMVTPKILFQDMCTFLGKQTEDDSFPPAGGDLHEGIPEYLVPVDRLTMPFLALFCTWLQGRQIGQTQGRPEPFPYSGRMRATCLANQFEPSSMVPCRLAYFGHPIVFCIALLKPLRASPACFPAKGSAQQL